MNQEEKDNQSRHDTITDINTNIEGAILDIRSQLNARSASVAITKLQEAIFWLKNLDETGE